MSLAVEDHQPAADLRTARLFLIRVNAGGLSALIAGAPEYERVFGMAVEEEFIEYPDMLVFLQQQATASPGRKHWWLPYLMIHGEDPKVVGICGYKGPPDTDGYVEIGYNIAPAWRGMGLATEAAAALAAHALEDLTLAGVKALTLPQAGASASILAKCGFQRVADRMDPEEGRLWSWELAGTGTPSAP